MAFSKELEEVIEAALADGVLTDKERAVLHKKAAQEGVDPDELDVVIEGRLAKMKREEDWLRPTPPSSKKMGDFLKCPSCGAQVIGGSAVCPECGYTFSNLQSNSSAEKLQNKLDEFNRRQEIRDANRGLANSFFHGVSKVYGRDSAPAHKMDIVSHFPVPNTRADLLEFMTMIQPRINSLGSKRGIDSTNGEDLSYAYWLLYSNCINKAKISFSNDADFAPYFAIYEKEASKLKGIIGYIRSHPMAQLGIVWFVLMLVFFGIPLLIHCSSKDSIPEDSYNSYTQESSSIDEDESSNINEDESINDIVDTYIQSFVEDPDLSIKENVDVQSEMLNSYITSFEKPTDNNYTDLVMKLKLLKWTPITEEAETEKSMFKSPSEDEKYERKQRKAFNEKIKSLAKMLQNFHKSSKKYGGEDDNLVELEKNGYEE